MIALLTSTDDLAADILVIALKRRGLRFIRLNEDTLPASTRLNWRLDDSTIQVADERFNVADVKSVWCRKLGRSVLSADKRDPGLNEFIKGTSVIALHGLFMRSARIWMNEPLQQIRAENKLLQLEAANAQGFAIPRTVVSNDPSEVRRFVAANRTVVKSLHGSRIELDRRRLTLVAHGLDDTHDVDDAEISSCVAIYQQRIAKAYELRITVAGARVFATRIVTPSDPVDWHVFDDSKVNYHIHSIPDALSAKCVRMLDRFGLSYGAIDVVVDQSGDAFFLELNPGGQWGWLERATGQPITDAIIDVLSDGR